MKKAFLTIAVLALLAAGTAAEERFGVKVYPNATTDASTAGYCKQLVREDGKARNGLKTQAYCFRTGDSFAKVTAFYRKHKGLELFGNVSQRAERKAAVFCLPEMQCAALGSGLDVTVRTPWGDGYRQRDVLITIRESRR